jgi:hypothetical protein
MCRARHPGAACSRAASRQQTHTVATHTPQQHSLVRRALALPALASNGIFLLARAPNRVRTCCVTSVSVSDVRIEKWALTGGLGMPTNPRYWSLSMPVVGVPPPYSATTHRKRISTCAPILFPKLSSSSCLSSAALPWPHDVWRQITASRGIGRAPSACHSQRAAGQGGLSLARGRQAGGFAQADSGPKQLRARRAGRTADHRHVVAGSPVPPLHNSLLSPALPPLPLSFSCSPRPPSLSSVPCKSWNICTHTGRAGQMLAQRACCCPAACGRMQATM